METAGFTAYKRTVEILMENGHYRSDAEKLADKIVSELLPQEEVELEVCGQCTGRKTISIVVDHGNKSTTHWSCVCGRCFGTGKILQEKREFY